MNNTGVVSLNKPPLNVGPPNNAWFIPTRTWHRALVTSAAIAAAMFPLYADDSVWIGVGIFATVLVSWHTLAARRTLPWIPGLIALPACIQWVLAPWAAYHLPVMTPLSGMAVGSHEYFSFATPALVALIVGLYLPSRTLGRRVFSRPRVVFDQRNRVLRRSCEALVVIGAVASVIFSAGFGGSGLKMAIYLVSILGFVGALGLALLRVPAWRWWATVPFAFVVYRAAAEGSFLELLFWLVYFAASVAYQYQVKMRVLVPLVVVGGFAVVTVNGYKNYYRDAILRSGAESGVRAGMTADAFVELIKAPSVVLSPQSLSFSINRLNMGWVGSRALVWTPAVEPFAHGETVETALRAALVPRLLDSQKYVAGGKYNTPRFTGIPLYNETSINLGVAVEMYVNYGLTLGVFALFVYGLAVGWIFSRFVRWSRQSQLWWAWAPYVMFSTLSAESGLGETLNQITKSALVMLVVLVVAPGWSRLFEEVRRRKASHAGGVAGPVGTVESY